MPTREPETQPSPHDGPSTFASRKAERAAAEARGEAPPKWQSPTLRAGIDAETPNMVVTRVRA